MPREGIEYPGWFNRAACSIRCELSKLWSAVGTKLSKINTVEPDGDGKVNIVSDSATLTVTDDPSNNAVRLELDAGLSSPPVQSVNGHTGTVVLTGIDVKGSLNDYNGQTYNQSIQTAHNSLAYQAKLSDDALRTRMTAAETAISDEASDRATADNALAAQIATKAGIGDTVVKNPVAAQSIAGYDLEIQENLDVDGDADVGGDLSVTGTTAASVLTVSGAATFSSSPSVPNTTVGDTTTKAVNGKRVVDELNNYAPMVRTTGNQSIGGNKQFTFAINQKASSVNGYTDPSSYISNRGNFRIIGNDDGMVTGIGFEKSATGAVRMVLSFNASQDSNTGIQPVGEIHFILNESAGTIVMQPAHVDKNNVRTFGTATTLMTWTP